MPKMAEQPEPGYVNWILHQSSRVGEVGVEPPPEPPVKVLRAVEIRDRDDHYLELHVDSRDREHDRDLSVGVHRSSGVSSHFSNQVFVHSTEP